MASSEFYFKSEVRERAAESFKHELMTCVRGCLGQCHVADRKSVV